MGKSIPDFMAAYGLWDYGINTQTFQDSKRYLRFLQEKAGTDEIDTMFQAEAQSMQVILSATEKKIKSRYF